MSFLNVQCFVSTITVSTFTTLKKKKKNPLCFPYSGLPPHNVIATTDMFTVSVFLPVAECHVNGTIQYVALSDMLFPT